MHLCVNENAKQIVRHITKYIAISQFLTYKLKVCVLRERGSLIINRSTFTGTKTVLKT